MRARLQSTRRISVRVLGAALGFALLTISAPAAAAEPWGTGSLSLVERWGTLAVGSPEHGQSGGQFGSGLEARFMMPIGWGAYYRTNRAATNNGDNFDWSHFEFSAGFSRRIVRGGSANLFSPRYQVHFDFGMLYSKLGTNERCTRSWAPLYTKCETTTSDHPVNLDGSYFGLEARIGADVSFGPLGVGVDVGIGGFRRIVTGGNSADPPTWFAAPTAQLKMGIELPFL